MNTFSPRSWQVVILLLVVIGLLLFAISGYLGVALQAVLDPLVGAQYWISSRYIAIYEFFTIPRDAASLRQRNTELEGEVASLQTQVVQLQQQLREAQVLYALLDFARDKPENVYIAGAVIGRDPSPFLHYVIIDHGSADGLRHGMPVVTQQGLVGRIDAVTAGAARVQLITDAASAVNIRFQSMQTEAVMVGSITGDITIEMIPQNIALQSGELVLTSGLGGNYPSDVVIGQVISIRKRETDLFQTASVQPSVDFASLHAVLVITNFRPVDINPLIPTSFP